LISERLALQVIVTWNGWSLRPKQYAYKHSYSSNIKATDLDGVASAEAATLYSLQIAGLSGRCCPTELLYSDVTAGSSRLSSVTIQSNIMVVRQKFSRYDDQMLTNDRRDNLRPLGLYKSLADGTVSLPSACAIQMFPAISSR
jgi:hypothetical protein